MVTVLKAWLVKPFLKWAAGYLFVWGVKALQSFLKTRAGKRAAIRFMKSETGRLVMIKALQKKREQYLKQFELWQMKQKISKPENRSKLTQN